ncbi:MAG: PIN domain-containing protein [Solirubrobacteraceae bacterium]|nr:MAG: VapC toxin family PIN domain ribonuclease [Solirubrobacterales bacterium]
MAVLIDTDLLVDVEHGVAAPEIDQLLRDQERAISVITVSELLHGVHRATGARRARRSAFVEHLLAGLQAILITEQVARVHADIWAQLAKRGQAIGAHDLWIAATAIAHGLSLATGNAAEFSRVPGLRVLGSPSATSKTVLDLQTPRSCAAGGHGRDCHARRA